MTGNTLLTGNLTQSGFSNIVGSLQVTGNTLLAGNVTVSAALMTVGANLIVNGLTTANGTLVVNGVISGGNTTLTGYVNVSTTLQVTGNTLLTGNVILSGFINVAGNSTFTGNVIFGAWANVANTLSVTGNVALGNTNVAGNLYVSGLFTVAGNSIHTGNSTFSSNITANGIITTYNNTATLGVGVPYIVASQSRLAQTAATTAVTVYSPLTAGLFRLSLYAVIVTANQNSTLGNISLSYQTIGSAVNVTPNMICETGNGTAQINTTSNTVGTFLSLSTVLFANAGTNITYTVGYSATSANMAYNVYVTLEPITGS